MARPQKAGLEYFPLDVDIDSDERVEYIEGRFGAEGFSTIIHLLMAIYRNSYYLPWSDVQIYTIARRVNLPATTLNEIVNQCITVGLFDVNLWETYGILTSHGIQARYIKACDYRKKIKMVKEFCLLTAADNVKEGRFQYVEPPKTVIRRKTIDDDGVNLRKTIDDDGVMSRKTGENKVNKSISSCCSSPYNPPEEEKQPDEEAELADKDEATANVFTLFENNIHPITGQIETDTLTDLLDRYGEHWLIEAIKETAMNNGHSVKYIKSILEAWERNGFKAEKPERSKTNGGRPQSNARRNQKKRTPEEEAAKWANETSGW